MKPIRWKKHFIYYGCWTVAIICLVATLYYHRDLPFNKSFDAIIYSPDTTFVKQTVVTLVGEKYRRLSGKHRIAGDITFDQDVSYPFTADLDGNQYESMIPYWSEDGSQLTLGIIHISKDLDQVWIKSNEIISRYQLQDGYVYGPASSKQDVGRSLNKMLYGK
ncbi:hypothetical protein [Paenibacillus sp. Marseille-Q4541]|uniref:hypothetical protein n=1 Tax=Paenibacillus sp. Marseille-Q4541 TaxID=2831522 RepID=UPI001BA7622A|nr:hypothetical protein [Paenibacillus sp. Marseille-Q4541]